MRCTIALQANAGMLPTFPNQLMERSGRRWLRNRARVIAYHWPSESGLPKRRLDTRIDRNCRVVMTAANISAPKVLIVCRINSCPVG